MASDVCRTCGAKLKGLRGGHVVLCFLKMQCVAYVCVGAFVLSQVKLSSPRDLLGAAG